MTAYVAFLRGVNVGGNNLVSKNDLAAIGERAGIFRAVMSS
ncbi:DUF1697 domain-containing protein [Methanoregula sp. UBA64]|nr:DUF1697 domain-containing protein [Methanoregula sp. UBA64]